MKNPQISVPQPVPELFQREGAGRLENCGLLPLYARQAGRRLGSMRLYAHFRMGLAMEKLIPKSPVEAKAFAAKNLQVDWRLAATQDILRFDDDCMPCLQKRRLQASCLWKLSGAFPPGRFIFETRNLVVEGGSYDGFSRASDQSNDRGRSLFCGCILWPWKNENTFLHFAPGRLERWKRPYPEPTNSSAGCHEAPEHGDDRRIHPGGGPGTCMPRSICCSMSAHTGWTRTGHTSLAPAYAIRSLSG